MFPSMNLIYANVVCLSYRVLDLSTKFVYITSISISWSWSLLLQRRDTGAIEFTQKFFKQIMWRSSKVHVADELQLPPQEEYTSWLTFSPIEEHFYQRQHETCAIFAQEVIQGLKDGILKRKVSGCLWLFHHQSRVSF